MRHKIQNFNVTAQLALIQSKAQLSNAVSRQALADAAGTWTTHQARYDYERNASDLIAIKRNINLIVAQITNRVCRVNPLMWTELLKLNAVVTVAILNKINLEPRPLPVGLVEPANDNDNLAEVSNG